MSFTTTNWGILPREHPHRDFVIVCHVHYGFDDRGLGNMLPPPGTIWWWENLGQAKSKQDLRDSLIFPRVAIVNDRKVSFVSVPLRAPSSNFLVSIGSLWAWNLFQDFLIHSILEFALHPLHPYSLNLMCTISLSLPDIPMHVFVDRWVKWSP